MLLFEMLPKCLLSLRTVKKCIKNVKAKSEKVVHLKFLNFTLSDSVATVSLYFQH